MKKTEGIKRTQQGIIRVQQAHGYGTLEKKKVCSFVQIDAKEVGVLLAEGGVGKVELVLLYARSYKQ